MKTLIVSFILFVTGCGALEVTDAAAICGTTGNPCCASDAGVGTCDANSYCDWAGRSGPQNMCIKAAGGFMQRCLVGDKCDHGLSCASDTAAKSVCIYPVPEPGTGALGEYCMKSYQADGTIAPPCQGDQCRFYCLPGLRCSISHANGPVAYCTTP